jgi:hypothetical protein
MAAPRGLGTAGRALWRTLCKAYELDAGELLTLTEACRLADLAADLEAASRKAGLTPQASAEIRRLRMSVATLTRDLAPAGDGIAAPSASDLGRQLALRRTRTGRAQ